MTADKHETNMAEADCVQNESPSYSPFRYVNHILFCENIALCELEASSCICFLKVIAFH